MPFLHQAYIALTYGIRIFRGILILNLSYRYLILVPMVERGIESLNNYLTIEMPCIANCYMGGTSRIHPPEPHSTTNLHMPSTSMVETTITSSPPLSLSTSITTPPAISTLPINLSVIESLFELMILIILFIDVYTCFSYLIRRIGYFSRPHSSSNPLEPTNSPDLNGSNLCRDSLEPDPPSTSDSADPPVNLSQGGLGSDISTLNDQHLETENENNETQHETHNDNQSVDTPAESSSDSSSSNETCDQEQFPYTYVEDQEQPSTDAPFDATQESGEEIAYGTAGIELSEMRIMGSLNKNDKDKLSEPFDASNQASSSGAASALVDHYYQSNSNLGGESALPADSDESYSDLEDDLPHIPAPGITTENPENSSMRQ